MRTASTSSSQLGMENMMSNIILRTATLPDVAECGRILHAAFAAVADHHNFPREFPSVEAATEEASILINHPDFYGLIAEQDSRILGSNFIEMRSPIAGIGPITVDPSVQNQGIGRRLMQALMDHAMRANVAGIRLSQPAYNNRTLCLYTRLGFQAREPLSMLQGAPLNIQFAGYDVRNATVADIEVCSHLCRAVHGFDRQRELADAIAQDGASVVEHLGRITGYATGVGFFSHAVAQTNGGLKALIGAATAFPGPGFLLPTRNHEMFAWCLDNGLRLIMQATLMSTGLYNEPVGAYLPSSQY
jgi:predicted N-acetyltransferase YhbS